jgi:uncharacterized protein (DUF2342 family)
MIEKVKISAELMAEIRGVDDKRRALGTFVNNMIVKGEQTQREYTEESQNIWKKLATTYGIDIQNVVWNIHPTKDEIIPVTVNLIKGNTNV